MTALPPEALVNGQVGRYACPACSARFTSLHDKKVHLRTDHPRKAQT